MAVKGGPTEHLEGLEVLIFSHPLNGIMTPGPPMLLMKDMLNGGERDEEGKELCLW